MQSPDRATGGFARIGAAHPGRVRGHGAQFLGHLVQRFTQGDGVAVGLGHFLAIHPRQARGGRQQRLGLDQDLASAAFQIAQQAVALVGGQHALRLDQSPRCGQGLAIALFLVALAQFAVAPDGFRVQPL